MAHRKTKFARCVESVASRGGARSPAGVCAAAGRKKYGPAEFARMAADGRRKVRTNPGTWRLLTYAEDAADARGLAAEMNRLAKRDASGETYRSKKLSAAEMKKAGSYGHSTKWGVEVRGLQQNAGADPWKKYETAFRRAEAADDKFQGALEKAYGSNAGTIRYQAARQSPAIRRLGAAYVKASGEMKRALDAARAKDNPSRRNPVDAAERAYKDFHGRRSEETLTIDTPIHEHSVLAGLGELEKLIILTADGSKVTLKNFGGSILCENEERTQLYVEGGDQAVDLEVFGLFTPYHETEVLGQCRNVYYFTRKDHLGKDGGTAIFNHKFGGLRPVKTASGKVRRKRSPLPTIIYDVRNKLLSFAGGGYTIPDEGIDH